MKKLKKLFLFLIPAVFALSLLVSCGDAEEEDDGIAYEAPESGITINKLQLISIGPGADCSNEMTANWHSPVPVNYIEFTTADDTAFAKSRKIWVKAELTKGAFTGTNGVQYGWCSNKALDNTKFYVCKATLTNLKANTDFIYRVGTNGPNAMVSDTYKFKTASSNGEQFSFFWAADLHTPSGSSSYVKRISELINYSNKKLKNASLPEISHVLFSGDLVEAGAVYQDWLYWDKIPELKEYMWATCVGNHDYYWYDGYRIDGSKARVSCRWQLECTAFPDTNRYTKADGTEVVISPANYWYLYNRVLFIGVDSMSEETKDGEYKCGVSEEKKWFKAVVEANKGKFDYLVAFQHYSCFEAGDVLDWGPYSNWKATYDSCGVDFALGSDTHAYCRTYELYKDKKVADGQTGTVYVTSPMTEGSALSAFTNNATSGNCEYYGDGGEKGGCYFVVNSDSMTVYTIGSSGMIYDQKSVAKKKR